MSTNIDDLIAQRVAARRAAGPARVVEAVPAQGRLNVQMPKQRDHKLLFTLILGRAHVNNQQGFDKGKRHIQSPRLSMKSIQWLVREAQQENGGPLFDEPWTDILNDLVEAGFIVRETSDYDGSYRFTPKVLHTGQPTVRSARSAKGGRSSGLLRGIQEALSNFAEVADATGTDGK